MSRRYRGRPHAVRCRDCNALIRWAGSPEGRYMPVDVNPPKGTANVVLDPNPIRPQVPEARFVKPGTGTHRRHHCDPAEIADLAKRRAEYRAAQGGAR